MQYEHILKENFPDLIVVGENYPPSSLRLQLNKIVSVFKLVLIGTVIAGPTVFGTFGRNPPGWFLWTQENKFASIFLTWIVCGQVESALLSTGAFEVYFNDVPIHSALKTGHPPSIEQIAGSINNHIVPNTIDSEIFNHITNK
ncbi:Selenoprotein T [Oopsacas minuta]|uniref:Selenoprotein T n=1 Tax=Oopsacas minuta TaxID=111878 RepID=A0AAV7K0T6_9METZ|nr:Selenoprotein T [Oopsacas minuta]